MALSEEALKQTGFVLHDAAALPLPSVFVRMEEQSLSHPSSDQGSCPGESIHERFQQSPFPSDMEWELLLRKTVYTTALFGKYYPE